MASLGLIELRCLFLVVQFSSHTKGPLFLHSFPRVRIKAYPHNSWEPVPGRCQIHCQQVLGAGWAAVSHGIWQQRRSNLWHPDEHSLADCASIRVLHLHGFPQWERSFSETGRWENILQSTGTADNTNMNTKTLLPLVHIIGILSVQTTK